MKRLTPQTKTASAHAHTHTEKHSQTHTLPTLPSHWLGLLQSGGALDQSSQRTENLYFYCCCDCWIDRLIRRRDGKPQENLHQNRSRLQGHIYPLDPGRSAADPGRCAPGSRFSGEGLARFMDVHDVQLRCIHQFARIAYK